jgi:hypothetical protein
MFKNKKLKTTNMPVWFYQNQDQEFLFDKKKQNLNDHAYFIRGK